MAITPIATELDWLIYWIREREAVRCARVAGALKPWTNDRLLREYRWCNVSRMDDRVSKDLFAEWYGDDAPGAQLVAATLGRLINWPEALLDATGGRHFTMRLLPQIRPALHVRAARGEKVFTGAYVIPGVPGRNKIESILDLVDQVADRGATILKPTLRSTWSALTELDGLGSFLAGQIAADLAQLSCGAAWPDRFTWAPVGPGSARGINRLLGRPKDQVVTQVQFDVELTEYIKLLRPRIIEIDRSRSLCAQDYQSTLCEFDKFRRLQLGEGKVRARYDGAGVGDAQGALL